MVLKEIATRRKTARIFGTDLVSHDDIKYILETARQAPCGSNTQRVCVCVSPQFGIMMIGIGKQGLIVEEKGKYYLVEEQTNNL